MSLCTACACIVHIYGGHTVYIQLAPAKPDNFLMDSKRERVYLFYDAEGTNTKPKWEAGDTAALETKAWGVWNSRKYVEA